MDKLAVFGNPIAHSLSPLIHMDFAKQENRAIEYDRILVTESFEQEAQHFFSLDSARGCNITVPCKLDAFNFVTELTDRAKIAGAVNTIKKTANGFIGDNTDGFGFFTDLQRLNCPLAQSSILIIGAGGASRGILPSLLASSAQVKQIFIVNRSLNKAQDIVNSMVALGLTTHEQLKALSFEQLNDSSLDPSLAFKADVVINATSLSLTKELPNISEQILANSKFVYDLYYTKEQETVFTKHCKALGVKESYDGLGMLVGQAALSYKLWFDFMPNLEQTMDYMRSILAKK